MWIGIPVDGGAWHTQPQPHPSEASCGGTDGGPGFFCLGFFFGIAWILYELI
jgi:hypothetical protein